MTTLSTVDQEFMRYARSDEGFSMFLRDVGADQQRVWLSELVMILKLLWEIFQIMKGLGWFQRRALRRRVRTIMAHPSDGYHYSELTKISLEYAMKEDR